MISLCLLAASGCGRRRERILNPRVPRNPVVFESPRAATLFEEALRDRYDDGEGEVPGGTLSLNAFFNREVETADLDGDGILSEAEALAYAAD